DELDRSPGARLPRNSHVIFACRHFSAIIHCRLISRPHDHQSGHRHDAFDVTTRWIECNSGAKFVLRVPHDTIAADGTESERATSPKSDDENPPGIDELARNQQVQTS